MNRIDLDYFYSFGRAMFALEECFARVPCEISSRDWSRISTALKWLGPIANGRTELAMPGLPKLAGELVVRLEALVSHYKEETVMLPAKIQAEVNFNITSFNVVMRSSASETYAFFVSDKGAYSARVLLEDASFQLSQAAQQSLAKSEKTDFQLAGVCLAYQLSTAAGFHAMRAVEAEARRYHRAVTSRTDEVDWTLEPLINGNSGKGQFGLRDQWKKEGSKDDSPLHLIMTLLKSIAQIYRNPIMHPEMILNPASAKKVFDTAALAISTMVEDRTYRAGLPPVSP